MMSSPFPTLAISCLYLIFLWAGPKYMQDRQPYTLRKTLIVYNFSMVVLNFYIAKEVSAIVAFEGPIIAESGGTRCLKEPRYGAWQILGRI